MEEKTLKTLEYNKIIDILSSYADSAPGEELCRKLRPSANYRHINSWQDNTLDAKKRLELKGRISFGALKSIDSELKKINIGALLSMGELLKISDILSLTEKVKAYDSLDPITGEKSTDEYSDSLSEYFELLEPLISENKEINRCILSEEKIADDASGGLMDIRTKIKHCLNSIHDTMQTKLNTLKDYLSDTVITERDGRFCLPVKAEFKSKVPGFLHDTSQSGMTLFIEPASVFNLSNELMELEKKEEAEIEKVLRALTNSLIPHIDLIADNIKILTRLDMIFAKAKYAEEISAVRPIFSKDRTFDIKEARHPLLKRDKVVPIDIRLGIDFDELVITGPNTGGKTVSLKTVGLLSLMALAGLEVPAAEGSVFAVFNEIYADIGDEQSIEQSLSTFSAHMTNIAHILERANDRTLCLFDELGQGTDPEEGSALCIAILDFLRIKKCPTIATTHYSDVKIYALKTKRVENASSEFDIESLSPTYKLLIGIPGKSNAFDIASRIGIPGEIIESARARKNSADEGIEDVIKTLNEKNARLEKDREEASAYKEEIMHLRERLKQKESRLISDQDKILKKARDKAENILKDAKETADSAISSINKLSFSGDYKKIEEERTRLREKLSKTKSSLKEPIKGPSRPVSPKNIKEGDKIKIMPMGGIIATVLEAPDKDGNISVQIGMMKSRVKVRDIELATALEEKEAEKNNQPNGSDKRGSTFSPKVRYVSSECNLIGETTFDARPTLEKYLDDAYMAHLGQVRIVHGRGTGALKDMVIDTLRSVSYVDSFRPGGPGEGSDGVTVVKFK